MKNCRGLYVFVCFFVLFFFFFSSNHQVSLIVARFLFLFIRQNIRVHNKSALAKNVIRDNSIPGKDFMRKACSNCMHANGHQFLVLTPKTKNTRCWD